MKRSLKWLPVALFALWVPVAYVFQASAAAEDPALSQLVSTVLQHVQDLHPGMPRSALKTFFDEDGGLQSFGENRYDYRLCHSIKIDVKFKSKAKTKDEPLREEHEDDLIVEISKPYLQYPFSD